MDASNAPKRRVFKIALTGGPCAGKSSIKSHLIDSLSKDFHIIFVVEAGALSREAGLKLHSYLDNEQAIINMFTQETLLQMKHEDYYSSFHPFGTQDMLLISDRGAVDNWAWARPDHLEQTLKNLGMTKHQIRDDRYDFVINMVTAALGAEEHYKTEIHRIEDKQAAIDLEVKFLENWREHPNMIVVSNEKVDFGHKADTVVQAIRNELGASDYGFGRRYLVEMDAKAYLNWPGCRTNEFEEVIHVWETEGGRTTTLKEIVG